jgi:hypothetical protein
MSNFMRHTTLVLIAILAIALLMPTIWALEPYLVNNPKNLTLEPIKSRYLSDPWLSNQVAVVTTPSMAAFLGENWMPNSTYNGTIYSGDYANIYPYGTVALGTMLNVVTPEYDAMLQNASKPNAALPIIVYADNSAIPNPTRVPGSNKWIPHVVS